MTLFFVFLYSLNNRSSFAVLVPIFTAQTNSTDRPAESKASNG